jgi:hypothetical protein
VNIRAPIGNKARADAALAIHAATPGIEGAVDCYVAMTPGDPAARHPRQLLMPAKTT